MIPYRRPPIHRLTAFGETKTFAEWADDPRRGKGVEVSHLANRKCGLLWDDDERIVTTPVRPPRAAKQTASMTVHVTPEIREAARRWGSAENLSTRVALARLALLPRPCASLPRETFRVRGAKEIRFFVTPVEASRLRVAAIAERLPLSTYLRCHLRAVLQGVLPCPPSK